MIVEIWQSDESFTATEKGSSHVKVLLEIESNCRLIKEIHGVDWTDCMRQYHEFMRWEPYKPFDES